MNAFSFFESVVCLNLDRRTDRWQECQAEFTALSIKPERISAISHPHGPYGCSLSHITAMKKYRNAKSLLIFEDDFCLKGDLSYLPEALASLPPDWEALYLGGLVFPDEINRDRIGSHLHVAKNVVCCHAYGLSAAGIEKMLTGFAPMVAGGSRTPVDEYMRSVMQPAGKTFIVTPMLFDQRPSYSDNTKQPASAHNLFSITNNKFQ